jgi:MSHA biogenesis protein MshI
MKLKLMQWFKRNQSDAWTSIRCTDDHITIASVRRSPNEKPRVSLAEIASSNGQNQVTLNALSKKHKLNKASCSLVLGYSRCQLLQIEKPNVPASELKQAIRWKLKDMVDYPVEQATVDVIDIPSDPMNANRQQYVYAVSAENSHIAEDGNQLIQAGINLQAIDARVMAQRNIAQQLEQKNRGLAMLSFNSSGGLLTFTSGGELYHARRIDMEGERNNKVFETITLELQRSLDHFDSQFSYITINKLVLAPFELRDAFCEYLRGQLNLPIETFELSDIFEFEPSVELGDLAHQASLLPVLGGALREEARS